MAKVQQNWLLRPVLVLVGGLSLLMAGEGRVPKKADPSPRSRQVEKAKATSPPLIGYLETKDRVITVVGGSKYTVKTKTGKVLAENIGLDKLQARFPDLYKLVDGSVAREGKLSAVR